MISKSVLNHSKAFKEMSLEELKQLSSHRIKGPAATLATNDLFESSRSLENYWSISHHSGVHTGTGYNPSVSSIKEFLNKTKLLNLS